MGDRTRIENIEKIIVLRSLHKGYNYNEAADFANVSHNRDNEQVKLDLKSF